MKDVKLISTLHRAKIVETGKKNQNQKGETKDRAE
jgi:hypothetical protein